MKKWLIISICVTLAAVIGVAAFFIVRDARLKKLPVVSLVEVEHLSFMDLDSLADDSDLIVIAEPVRPVYYDPGYRDDDSDFAEFYTMREIKILKTLKGETTGKYMRYFEYASYDGDRIIKLDDYVIPHAGTKYIFFFSKWGKDGVYSIASLHYGLFNIDGKHEVKQKLQNDVMAAYRTEIESAK